MLIFQEFDVNPLLCHYMNNLVKSLSEQINEIAIKSKN